MLLQCHSIFKVQKVALFACCFFFSVAAFGGQLGVVDENTLIILPPPVVVEPPVVEPPVVVVPVVVDTPVTGSSVVDVPVVETSGVEIPVAQGAVSTSSVASGKFSSLVSKMMSEDAEATINPSDLLTAAKSLDGVRREKALAYIDKILENPYVPKSDKAIFLGFRNDLSN